MGAIGYAIKAREVMDVLDKHKGWVAAVPSPEVALSLVTFGVPSDRIVQLACIWKASATRIVFLSRQQLAYYRREEARILAEAVGEKG